MPACTPPEPLDALRVAHLVAATLHFVSFCLLAALPALQTPEAFPTDVGPVAYNYTRDATCAAPQWRVDAAVRTTYVHASPLLGVQVNEVLTFVSHVVGSIFLACNLQAPVVEQRRRWVEYAVTAGILEISILVGYGVRDWFALLLVFCLNIGLQVSGGLSLDELRASFPGTSFYRQQRTLLLSQSVVFLGVQLAYTITTALESATPGVGDTLVASSVLYAVFYASFGVVQTLSHCAPRFDARYDTPVFFVLLSVTSKLCLSWHAVHVQQLVQDVLRAESAAATAAELRTAVAWLYGVSAAAIIAYVLWRSLLKLPAASAASADSAATKRPLRRQYRPLNMRST